MKNTIRCCISCILPCGALDVIRIVHSNGRVEEISGTIRASDIMKAYPKHLLKKPSSPSSADDGVVPKIVVVPPDAELQRGKIYFLMPMPPSSSSSSSKTTTATTTTNTPEKCRPSSRPPSKKKRRDFHHHNGHHHRRHPSQSGKSNSISMTTSSNFLVSDQYLSEILSEKLSMQRDRRRGRVGVWRPHLESICESPSDVI